MAFLFVVLRENLVSRFTQHSLNNFFAGMTMVWSFILMTWALENEMASTNIVT